MSMPTHVTLAKSSGASQTLLQVSWIGLCAAGTALAARAEIPHVPVPYTLQTLMVLLAGAFLGPRNGFLSQVAYIGAGILGAPVFAGGAAGLAVLLGPTGGYLLSFPIASAIAGALVRHRHTLPWITLSMAAALAVVFTLGAAYLALFYTHRFSTALDAGVLIFSWWDCLKLGAASMIYFEAGKRWKTIPPRSGAQGV